MYTSIFFLSLKYLWQFTGAGGFRLAPVFKSVNAPPTTSATSPTTSERNGDTTVVKMRLAVFVRGGEEEEKGGASFGMKAFILQVSSNLHSTV